MGQSQSQIEKNKQRPINPKKIFGLIFFQRSYDAVVQKKEDLIEVKYNAKRQELEDQKKGNGDKFDKQQTEDFNAAKEDEKKKKEIDQNQITDHKHYWAWCQYQGGDKLFYKARSLMSDVHYTYKDAKKMYKFMANKVCIDIRDITFICEEFDFRRIVEKPKYEGDFLKQMYDWNFNQKQADQEMDEVRTTLLNQDKEAAKREKWEKFEKNLTYTKFITKHKARQQKIRDVKEVIEKFVGKSQTMSLKELETEDLDFKIKCEDFWKKPDDPRRDQLFRKMHPLIFLKEQLPAYIKIQNNWIYQFLSEQQKKDLMQARRPQWQSTSQTQKSDQQPEKKENKTDDGPYLSYLKKIATYSKENPDQEVLSIQMFSCNGAIFQGRQVVLVNSYDDRNWFYKMWEVELELRQEAKKMNKVFFLLLFACCRDSYVSKNIVGDKNLYLEDQKGVERTRAGDGIQVSQVAIANFTLVFGSNPATGAQSDKKFVSAFIQHMNNMFDPEDGALMIPECLGNIDTLVNRVNFESTSSNVGRSLKLFRQDVRIARRQIVVIVKNDRHTKIAEKWAQETTDEKRNKDEAGIRSKWNEMDDKDPAKRKFENLPTTKLKEMHPNVFKEAQLQKIDVFNYVHPGLEAAKKQAKEDNTDSLDKEFEKVTEKNEIGNYDLVKKYAKASFEAEHPGEKFVFKKEGQVLIKERTLEVIDFFVEHLHFDKENILYFTEDEARNMVKLLDQSQIFKQYTKHLSGVLKLQAYRQFLNSGQNEQIFKHPPSNCQEMLSVFITESNEEDVKDFVINRNPEFAIQVVHAEDIQGAQSGNVKTEQELLARTQKYLNNLKEHLKTVNQIKFENLNRFFYIDPECLIFCARDNKMFKPGSGQFDIILDVEEKINQTVKAKFNYLEKLPLRKFKTQKMCLGCPIDEQEAQVLIVELKDVNNKLCHDEIVARTHLRVKQNKDGSKTSVAELKKKKVFAYVINPTEKEESIKLKRDYAKKHAIVVPDMDEQDEVIRLQKLYVDLIRKEMFFQIVLNKQHSITIVKVDFAFFCEPKIFIAQKQIVREAINRGDTENLGGEPHQPNPTELQHEFYDQLDLKRRKAIYRIKQRALYEKNEQKAEVKSSKIAYKLVARGEDDPYADLFPGKKHEELTEEELKKKEVLKKKVLDIVSKFKLKIEDSHLRVFAGRNPPSSDLFIYMFTNIKLINNMQSATEVEVFKWVEKGGKCEIADLVEPASFHDRPKYTIREEGKDKDYPEVSGQTMKTCKDECVIFSDNATAADFEKIGQKQEEQLKDKKTRTRRKGERMYINWAIRKPENDGWVDEDSQQPTKFFYRDTVKNETQEKDTEFWNKFPTVYKKSSDDVGRIIFNAGSRANWIYDLQLINGEIRIFSKQNVETCDAFGLQKRPFVEDIDFIDHNFISLLTKDKIFQWKHKTDIHKEDADQIDEGEETLLKALPAVVRAPSCKVPFLFALQQQSIQVVNIKTGLEYDLVKQRANCQNDSIEDLFLTYERDDKDTSKINKITLHYFEKFFDYRKKLKGCTYNTFELTEDFLQMIQTCGEILPSEKTKLVKTITAYKHQVDVTNMDEEERKKKEAAANEMDKKEQVRREIAIDKAGMDLHFTAMKNWLDATKNEQANLDKKVLDRVDAKMKELDALMAKIKSL